MSVGSFRLPLMSTGGGTTYAARFFNLADSATVTETVLIDNSGNDRDFDLTRRNCVVGDGTAKLTFSNLPTYTSLTAEVDGTVTSLSLTSSEYTMANTSKYNYFVFMNDGAIVAEFPLMEHDSDDTMETTFNFYDVIGSGASCTLSSGDSDNISKNDGLSWNFRYGFAVISGGYAQHPKNKNTGGYAGISEETIIEYLPFSLYANQFVKAPASDSTLIALDTNNQFYVSSTPVDMNLGDLIETTYIDITLDGDIITDLKFINS